MFVGHFAAAFVAKRLEPRLPLPALVLGTQAVDVAWAALTLAGVERARLDPALPGNPLWLDFIPYSHSLTGTLAWMLLLGALAAATLGGPGWRLRAFAVGALVVGSHWLGDLIVHRPDLGLVGDSHKVGLGLWNRPWAAYLLEVGLVMAAATWLAVRWVGPLRRRLLALAAAMVVVQTGQQWGPVLPSLTAEVLAALAGYGLAAWGAAWVERAGGAGARPQHPG